jgi:L-ribulose-5-phosphate 4-epimerase
MDEGFIKFNCDWITAGAIPEKEISQINYWRDKLFDLGLIGADKTGTGFGNISVRRKGGTFLITGAATGKLQKLDGSHYVLVNNYNFLENHLTCTGTIKASSESLTHAAVYECSPVTNAVIHVHSKIMWERLLDRIPSTSTKVAYGTPEMAGEIKRLFDETSVASEKVLVMGGHPEGIISFGATLDEAGESLLNYYKQK